MQQLVRCFALNILLISQLTGSRYVFSPLFETEHRELRHAMAHHWTELDDIKQAITQEIQGKMNNVEEMKMKISDTYKYPIFFKRIAGKKEYPCPKCK